MKKIGKSLYSKQISAREIKTLFFDKCINIYICMYSTKCPIGLVHP